MPRWVAWRQHGFTLVDTLVVIAILGILAAIVLIDVSGVNTSAACDTMKRDGSTVQRAAADYYAAKGVYPVVVGDKARPLAGEGVDLGKLVSTNLLRQAPDANKESFTYRTSPVGSIQGNLIPAKTGCIYN